MDHSFGTWIKRRRKALDLTQQQLAQKVGCSISLIFKIESDERRPSRQIAELLAQHLEIPPEQRELFLKVARQEKAIDGLSGFAPVSPPQPSFPAQPPQPKLPLPLTSLVGREHELRMVVQQLQDPACRLLTLTGPGGVGKTRLALEVAHQLRETFEDGACFVSLAGTTAPDFIIPAMADALGLVFSGSVEPKTQFFHFLREKQILLVLDNLEHLLNGIELLDLLLEAAPGVKVLTTSREQLNLRSEWMFEIQGLPIPSKIEIDKIASNSAASLFIQRAKQVNVNFSPLNEDLAAIARICQLVEGLPLGLELAATWVKTLSCREIATEIERGLGFLSTSRRDLPERHRSLQAVFQYSWSLLAAEQQVVLKSLSVFQGGFTRDAAERVAGATLSLISSLMGKSFLRRSDAGRYGQHELVRQYAALRLHDDPQEEVAAHARHAAYYLALWRDAERELKSSQQRESMQKLALDVDNFRAAWNWAAAQGQVATLGQCLRTLLLVYDLRGWYAEGIERVEAMLRNWSSARVSSQRDQEIKGLASALLGWFQFRRGRLNEAYEVFEQALEFVRPLPQPTIRAEVLSLASPMMTSLGEIGKALQYISEGLDAARASGETWHIAYALMMQGGILAGSGRNEEAYLSAQKALTYFRTLGDIRSIVVTLNTLGFVSLQLSRYTEAREFLQESLALVVPAEDPWSAGTAYGDLGIVELAQGNPGAAQTLLQNSIALFTDLGMMGDVAFHLTYLGEAFAVQGAKKDAEGHWLEAIRLASAAGALPTALGSLARLAQLRAEQGDIAKAYRWATQVASHPASWQESKNRANALRAELQSKLSPQQLDEIELVAPKDFPDPLIQQMLVRQL
ncbi:MAG TPA: tetratricopeptide repeat protein [Anaerolineales bacterium]|nr:tetratricopeptide repeat protein [Anaerolineales bacterium]